MGRNDKSKKRLLADQKKELLALLLTEEGFNVDQMQRIRPRSRAEHPPLSFAQQRLWFLDQLVPGSPAYNISTAVRLQGALDDTALRQSLNGVIRRHEMLRTTFATIDGQPVQLIAPDLALPLPIEDLSGLEAPEREAAARACAAQEARTAFDLARGPLLRAALLRLARHDHVLLLTLHHTIADGWSMGVLIRELAALYTAFVAGEPYRLAPLPIQYADFAIWQREWMQGEVLETQLAYWKQQLADLPQLELPADRPRPPIQTFRGDFRRLTIPASLTQALAGLSQHEGATLFMTLLAALTVLIHRYTGEDDIPIGSPIANR
ncbi:MAG TPA: condensation domain-containing protein, partial [Herpetosiphonaceae bacterium]